MSIQNNTKITPRLSYINLSPSTAFTFKNDQLRLSSMCPGSLYGLEISYLNKAPDIRNSFP